jgi:hypothetical protein
VILPGVVGLLAACFTVAIGLVGMLVALPLAEARRSRRPSSGFWASYARLSVGPLACAVAGFLWALYLNGASEADRYAVWPPLSGIALGALVAFWALRDEARIRKE